MLIDKSFLPIEKYLKDYSERVKKYANPQEVDVCLVRQDDYNYTFSLSILPDGIDNDTNYIVVERLIKASLWAVGGYKLYISSPDYVYERIKKAYSKGGERQFDSDMMARVYEREFEVIKADKSNFPTPKSASISVGGHLDGCRIGFDAGGSDRKVSAVVNGEVIYSEEVVWHPKTNSDPKYHYEGILAAMKTAASKMERVDAIGVSSAGIYVNNRIMVASLFVKVSDEDFEKYVKNMYIDVAKAMGNPPLEVANDGDVTALAGALALNSGSVLGIAMGTSEAVGYINKDMGINGWLNELAFAPVDLNPSAMADEWSGDIGVGCKYFSQDAVIKLANMAGYEFEDGLTPAEKLKVIQKLADSGDALALAVFTDIGEYLAHTLPFYSRFYGIRHVLLLGRVLSGKGGDTIINKAREVLASKYPDIQVLLSVPDEKTRRVGQSIAAASLPKIRS